MRGMVKLSQPTLLKIMLFAVLGSLVFDLYHFLAESSWLNWVVLAGDISLLFLVSAMLLKLRTQKKYWATHVSRVNRQTNVALS